MIIVIENTESFMNKKVRSLFIQVYNRFFDLDYVDYKNDTGS